MARDWTPEEWHAHCRGYGRRAKGPRKNQRQHPSDVQDFIDFGGMRQIEYLAAADAADQAKRFERECWLPRLEEWLTKWEIEHPKGDMMGDLYDGRLREEIKRLRRALGVHKGSEEQRAAGRERVRKSRERRRVEWNYPGSISLPPVRLTCPQE
jgi:hypothetical protein